MVDGLNAEYLSHGKAASLQGGKDVFTIENTDVYLLAGADGVPQVTRAADGRIVIDRSYGKKYVIAPVGSTVFSDGSIQPPKQPASFALQSQPGWGDEQGAYNSCVYDEPEQGFFACNCSTWIWWKLSEQNSSYDYWLVNSKSTIHNSGGGARNKSASTTSKMTSSGSVPLDWKPDATVSGSCSSVSMNISFSVAGVGVGTNITPVQHCNKTSPVNGGGPVSTYTGVKYTGPDDGSVDDKNMGSTLAFRVPANTDVTGHLYFSHGVTVGCYDNACTSCAL